MSLVEDSASNICSVLEMHMVIKFVGLLLARRLRTRHLALVAFEVPLFRRCFVLPALAGPDQANINNQAMPASKALT